MYDIYYYNEAFAHGFILWSINILLINEQYVHELVLEKLKDGRLNEQRSMFIARCNADNTIHNVFNLLRVGNDNSI